VAASLPGRSLMLAVEDALAAHPQRNPLERSLAGVSDWVDPDDGSLVPRPATRGGVAREAQRLESLQLDSPREDFADEAPRPSRQRQQQQQPAPQPLLQDDGDSDAQLISRLVRRRERPRQIGSARQLLPDAALWGANARPVSATAAPPQLPSSRPQQQQQQSQLLPPGDVDDGALLLSQSVDLTGGASRGGDSGLLRLDDTGDAPLALPVSAAPPLPPQQQPSRLDGLDELVRRNQGRLRQLRGAAEALDLPLLGDAPPAARRPGERRVAGGGGGELEWL
jgi:hypothetical protein